MLIRQTPDRSLSAAIEWFCTANRTLSPELAVRAISYRLMLPPVGPKVHTMNIVDSEGAVMK
jgi:hypothetical protein